MLKKALKIITAFLYAILIIFALFKARNMTPQDIIEYSPSNSYLAALFILGDIPLTLIFSVPKRKSERKLGRVGRTIC